MDGQTHALYSIVSSNVDAVIPTARSTKISFPERCPVSVIVRVTKPGPPESPSCVAQCPAAKSAAEPAHNARLVPDVLFSNASVNTFAVVVVARVFRTRCAKWAVNHRVDLFVRVPGRIGRAIGQLTA